MSVSKAIFALLDADSTVNGPVTEISPLWVDSASTLPYISYRLVSKDHVMTKDSPDQDKEVWSINVFSKTILEAETIADGVIAVLDEYAGTSGGTVIKNVVYEGRFMQDEDKTFQITDDFEFRITV